MEEGNALDHRSNSISMALDVHTKYKRAKVHVIWGRAYDVGALRMWSCDINLRIKTFFTRQDSFVNVIVDHHVSIN